MPRYNARAVFDYVRTSESDWRDPTTGIRLAPGAIQNWPTREMERWILEEIKRSKLQARLARAKAASAPATSEA